MTDTRRLAAFLAVGAIAAVAGAHARATPPRDDARTAVVAELFTSEGCSSCPPADDLLRRLIATQPVDGVEVVALGNHVDYWDRLGWRDPFSSPLFSARQSAYGATVFRSDQIYTPQLVVDGRLQAVGSDAAAVRRALREAAALPKAAVSVTATQHGADPAQVRIHVEMPANMPHHDADLMVAMTEDGLVSRVSRGENGGRTLLHSAVVRSLTVAGRLRAGERTATATTAVTLGSGWKAGNLRIVGFVQEQDSRRIIGGGWSPLRQGR